MPWLFIWLCCNVYLNVLPPIPVEGFLLTSSWLTTRLAVVCSFHLAVGWVKFALVVWSPKLVLVISAGSSCSWLLFGYETDIIVSGGDGYGCLLCLARVEADLYADTFWFAGWIKCRIFLGWDDKSIDLLTLSMAVVEFGTVCGGELSPKSFVVGLVLILRRLYFGFENAVGVKKLALFPACDTNKSLFNRSWGVGSGPIFYCA